MLVETGLFDLADLSRQQEGTRPRHLACEQGIGGRFARLPVLPIAPACLLVGLLPTQIGADALPTSWL